MNLNRCVSCGTPAKILFTEYGNQNFILEICSNCQNFLDFYIEQSPILLIIDLCLLKTQVYFHLLYNLTHSFQSYNFQVNTSLNIHSIKNNHRLIKSVKLDPSIQLFHSFHLNLSFFIYFFIFILESIFQSIDHSRTDNNLFDPIQLKKILIKLIELALHILNVTFTAIIISKIKKYQNLDPIKQLIINSIKAIIISFLPCTILHFTIMIFQNSYGTKTPNPLFKFKENQFNFLFFYFNNIKLIKKNQINLIKHFTLNNLVALDMDQIGSTKLKKLLIQNLLGNFSLSVAITVPFLQSHSFGLLVLTLSSIQFCLLNYLFLQNLSIWI